MPTNENDAVTPHQADMAMEANRNAEDEAVYNLNQPEIEHPAPPANRVIEVSPEHQIGHVLAGPVAQRDWHPTVPRDPSPETIAEDERITRENEDEDDEYEEDMDDAPEDLSSVPVVATEPEEPFDDRQEDFVILGQDWSYPVSELHKLRRAIVRNVERSGLQFISTLSPRRYVTQKNARIYGIDQLVIYIGFGNSAFRIIVLKEAPVKLGCSLADWFDAGFIAMMYEVPKNPVMRAHMMKVLKVGVPNEITTFDALKNWVETSFPKKRAPAPEPGYKSPIGARIAPAEPMFRAIVNQSGTENGTARYTIPVSRDIEDSIPISKIREWIQEGNSFDSIVRLSRDYVADHYDESTGCNYQNYEYQDHEPSDDGVEYDQDDLSQQSESELRAFIRDNDPGLYEEMENN